MDLLRQSIGLLDNLNTEDKKECKEALIDLFTKVLINPDESLRYIDIWNKDFARNIWCHAAGRMIILSSGWRLANGMLFLSTADELEEFLHCLTNDETDENSYGLDDNDDNLIEENDKDQSFGIETLYQQNSKDYTAMATSNTKRNDHVLPESKNFAQNNSVSSLSDIDSSSEENNHSGSNSSTLNYLSSDSDDVQSSIKIWETSFCNTAHQNIYDEKVDLSNVMKGVALLKSIYSEKKRQCIEALIKLYRNILQHPNEQGYRFIDIDDPQFKSEIWDHIGGRMIMLASGWKLKDTQLVLAQENNLRQYLDYFIESRVIRPEEEEKVVQNMANISNLDSKTTNSEACACENIETNKIDSTEEFNEVNHNIVETVGNVEKNILYENNLGCTEKLESCNINGIARGFCLLDELSSKLKRDCLETIIRLFKNIMRNPNDSKYRTVRVSNPKFSELVWMHDGGRKIMLSSGWKRNGDLLTVDNIDCVISSFEVLIMNREVKPKEEEWDERTKFIVSSSAKERESFLKEKALKEKEKELEELLKDMTKECIGSMWWNKYEK